MNLLDRFRQGGELLRLRRSHPRHFSAYFSNFKAYLRGVALSLRFLPPENPVPADGLYQTEPSGQSGDDPGNPLWEFFRNHESGPGIWKWCHYFDFYHRHLSGHRRQSPSVVEVGVYSGGSLGMWSAYFGEGAKVTGIDIEPAVRVYEREGVEIVIGDQEDREFWKSFKAGRAPVDIFIDDGGHSLNQQMVTMEEMLPFLACGGIYICEDIHGFENGMISFAAGLISSLYAMGEAAGASPFQSAVHSLHVYPYGLVIEKHRRPVAALASRKKGSQWQPFLS